MRERYFDNAATTPIDPRVLAEMMPFLTEDFGNANSIHSFGARAMAAIDLARERVAELIGAEDPSQIVFTSGATEANNWALAREWGDRGDWGDESEHAFSPRTSNLAPQTSPHSPASPPSPTHLASPFEHSAVREPALANGFSLLGNNGHTLEPPSLRASFLSVMSVNNEIGARWDPLELRDHTDRLHSDITQQVGKLPTSVEGLDYASFSAHKFYGPKGVGALYIANDPPPAFMLGGEQEMGRRAGTLNVPGIVGMGAAAAIAVQEVEADMIHAADLRGIFLEELGVTPPALRVPGEQSHDDVAIHGGPNASPYILSISFRGVEGETILIEADQAGFALSAGAACSSRSTEPSHVLTALGFSTDWIRGTVRISFGRFNTKEAACDLARQIRRTVEKLRTL